jgi:hypothetical protein
MRNIQVSTPVYAAIWADRQPGEESEDAILARRYGVKAEQQPERDISLTIGFRDLRHGVELPPGFSVFRTFKGKEYRAHAVQGFLVLNGTGQGYPTLNQLSVAIGAGKEDAWERWLCIHPETGKQVPVSELRDPSTIKRKAKLPLSREINEDIFASPE